MVENNIKIGNLIIKLHTVSSIEANVSMYIWCTSKICEDMICNMKFRQFFLKSVLKRIFPIQSKREIKILIFRFSYLRICCDIKIIRVADGIS